MSTPAGYYHFLFIKEQELGISDPGYGWVYAGADAVAACEFAKPWIKQWGALRKEVLYVLRLYWNGERYTEASVACSQPPPSGDILDVVEYHYIGW